MKTDVGLAHRFLRIGREGQAARAGVRDDELGKPRFEDRHRPARSAAILSVIRVDADDVVPEVGEAAPDTSPT